MIQVETIDEVPNGMMAYTDRFRVIKADDVILVTSIDNRLDEGWVAFKSVKGPFTFYV